jgi:protoheme IX farnesyltransferase
VRAVIREDVLTRFAKLAIAAAVATFVLISAGGLVRATDSGLGCPDWPGCFAFNDWIPPAELHAWIEHTHRLIAAFAVGPLIAAVGLITVFSPAKRRDRALLLAAAAAGVLVIIQAVLGAIVVWEQLRADLVSAHLAMALTVFALTLFIADRATNGPMPARPANRGLQRLAGWTAIAVFAQMVLGSWVTGHDAGLAFADFPLMNGALLPDFVTSEQVVQFAHRGLAVLVAVLVLLTWWRVRNATDETWPRRLAAIGALLILVQLAIGAANVWSRLSAFFVVPHLAVGAALWGSSVLLYLGVRRMARVPQPSAAARRAGDEPTTGDTVRAYIALTKPRIIELLLVTTVPTMVLAQRGIPSLWLMAATVIGGTLAAGGANAINQYVDRDIDPVMRRTQRRPLVRHTVTPQNALRFGIGLSVLSFVFLWVTVNLLSALLATSAIAFYVFVYTLWLKRSTPQGVVIGGAAGCVPVLVAWAAVTGTVEVPALVLFAIVFYWTPPHFWALALRYRGDYEAARVPMLPVVRGEAETARQILLYSLLLVVVSLLLLPAARMGVLYGVTAVVLGVAFVWYAVRIQRNAADGRAAVNLFRFSISYLTLLFAAVAADAIFRLPLG